MTAVAFCRLVQNQRLALSGTPRTVFETLWGQWYHRKTVLENAKGEKTLAILLTCATWFLVTPTISLQMLTPCPF